MKTQKEILKWLQANLGKHCTAPLTSTDCYALVASVNLCNLISYSSAPLELFAAYGAIVGQMQSHTGSSTFLMGKKAEIGFSGGAYDTGKDVSTDIGTG
jgi:hypothetical protein